MIGRATSIILAVRCNIAAMPMKIPIGCRAGSGLELVELDDWNCCGATEYFSINRLPAYALVARNLARAAAVRREGVGRAVQRMFSQPEQDRQAFAAIIPIGGQVNQALAAGDLHYDPGSVKVRHLLEVITQRFRYGSTGEAHETPAIRRQTRSLLRLSGGAPRWCV